MRRRLALLLLVLAASPAQAQATAFSGDVTAASLHATGADASGPLLFLGSLHLLEGSLLEVEAASADVVEHYQEYRWASTGNLSAPVNLHEDLGRMRQRTFHHEDVSAWSVRVGNEAFVQAEGTAGPGGLPSATAHAAADRAVAHERLLFRQPTSATDVLPPSDWEAYREGAWPNVEAQGVAGSVEVRGDVVVTFFDLDLLVRHRDGERTYQAGLSSDDGDPGDDAVEEGERRRVVATFRDAVLRLSPSGADVRLHYQQLTLAGQGAATLPGAEGTLLVGDRALSVSRDLRFSGDWTAALRPDGERVAAALEGSAQSLSVDGVGVGLATVAPEPPAARTAWSWLVPVLLALFLVPAAASHALRRRRLTPDVLVSAAGWELEAGRPRRAAAWSRRALRRDAADADAAAIRTVSLYRRGRHGEAVAWLGAWLDAHGDPTGELTLLLGLGRLETEGGAAAARTVQSALERDPCLRRLLEERHA